MSNKKPNKEKKIKVKVKLDPNNVSGTTGKPIKNTKSKPSKDLCARTASIHASRDKELENGDISPEEAQGLVEEYSKIGNVDRLNFKQIKAIDLLLKTDMNKGEVAKTLGIHPSTLWQYEQKPEFQALYDNAAREAAGVYRRERMKLYKTIASKGLDELMDRISTKSSRMFIKDSTLLNIIEKMVNLMQDEEGSKSLKLDINSTNTNANVDLKELIDYHDNEARMDILNLLEKHNKNK